MSIFGWSYPPGAANHPNAPWNQVEPPCAVCGRFSDTCVCPECPVCEVPGEPTCYMNGEHCGHGLQRSLDQMAGLMRLEEEQRKQAEDWDRYAEEWNNPSDELR